MHSEIYSGDTILTYKKGIWGEFLNLNNTVKINGYLYQITPEKKIIVTTGDPEDLEDADNMEESDTASGIYIITPRTCLCDNTQQQWFYAEKVETDNDNQDMTSTMIFTDVTLVEFMPNSKVIVYPKWTVESNIHIRKRGMFGIWHMERENIDYRREIEFTSNFETMPGDPSPCEWGESVSWTTGLEADYNHDVTESLDDYETDVTASMPLGYCIAVRNFIQRAEINDPALEVEFSFLPFPYPDMSDLHPLPPNVGCYIFDWLYFL